MTARHVLSAGGWVDLRDKSEVTERLRRPIKNSMAKLVSNKAFSTVVAEAEKGGIKSLADIPEEQQEELASKLAGSMGDLADLNDLIVIAKVAAWSYGDAVTVDALLDLPGPAYDEIQALVAPATAELMPDFSPSQDPASPTAPSIA